MRDSLSLMRFLVSGMEERAYARKYTVSPPLHSLFRQRFALLQHMHLERPFVKKLREPMI